VIRLESVTRLYGDHPAIDDLSLEVHQGQFVAVMGHNGAGKSTLLRLVAGLTRPTEGRVLVNDRELRRDNDARRAIGLLAHESYLYGTLTARENLHFTARLFGLTDSDEHVDALLADVGIAWAADLPVETYSRGMEQRAALARALLHDPELLLLDEPFAGLDQAAEAFLHEPLARLRGAGKTGLLVTHDPARAVRSADRLVVLKRGRVVFDEQVTGPLAETFPVTYSSLLGEGTA